VTAAVPSSAPAVAPDGSPSAAAPAAADGAAVHAELSEPSETSETADGEPPPEAHEDKPMLRPIDAYPVDHPSGQKLLALYDPSGIAPGVVTLPPFGAAVIDLFDGERDRAGICAEFAARYHRPLPPESLEALLKKLDDALLLDSTNFRLHCAKIFAEFAGQSDRPPQAAGTRYPAEPEAIRELLASAFAPPNGPGLPAAPPSEPPAAPRALLVPTVELQSGGPAYAWAFRTLLDARTLPSLIVLFGCDHSAQDPLLTFTRKNYQTPLGTLATDRELVDALLTEAGQVSTELGELLVRDEFHHRAEHSLEYAALWLSYVLGERKRRGIDEPAPTVVPILVGSLHELASLPPGKETAAHNTHAIDHTLPILQRLVGERVAQGGSVLWLGAGDLAHVGPRFGDLEALSDEDRDSLERRDQVTLKSVLAGDATNFLAEIRRERDRRRVLGLGTICTLLRAACATGGQLRCYAQCSVGPGSYISTASLVFK
jgi:AmmeMemoRadiSam system protein B